MTIYSLYLSLAGQITTAIQVPGRKSLLKCYVATFQLYTLRILDEWNPKRTSKKQKQKQKLIGLEDVTTPVPCRKFVQGLDLSPRCYTRVNNTRVNILDDYAIKRAQRL